VLRRSKSLVGVDRAADPQTQAALRVPAGANDELGD
jgi:hypothetical protein